MTDTNKILGQSVTLADGTASVLYTAPESTSAVASGLFTVNTADANCSYSIYAVPNDGSVETITTAELYSQKGTDLDAEAANDDSGRSVSLSSDGTILAIGAPYNDGVNGTDSGHVRVYEWSGTAWVQKGIDIDGEAAGDWSGRSVSLSSDGTILAIGAIWNKGNGTSAGHVRVYVWNGSAWVQRGADIDGEAANDNSGRSVSLSSDGTILAIGAAGNDGKGSAAGHVRVYEWSGSAWVQKGDDIDGEAAGDSSGSSVSLSSDGTTVAIGAAGNDGNGSGAGHVRVYAWNGSGWVQKGGDIDGEAANDNSGRSVSLSSDGTVVAIGADENDGNGSAAGHVRVYEWSGSAWVQKGDDIDGEAAGDESGFSVSLSSDGTIVAIGAPYNDGTGFKAGHVRVYEWNGSAWVQKASDVDAEATYDLFGWSVSMSSDGTVVAVGAIWNDGTGNFAGHVRVYEYAASKTTYSVDAKHALIKSRSILIGEHHEIQRGITLNSGDALWIEATDEVAVSLYGVEVS